MARSNSQCQDRRLCHALVCARSLLKVGRIFHFFVYAGCFLYTAHNSVDNCLLVVLGDKLVTERDVLGLGVLLAQASLDLLLPLVVLGLALYAVSGRSSWSSVRARRSTAVCERRQMFGTLVVRTCVRGSSTYSEVEHARLLGLAEVLALGNLSVGVQL